MTELWKVQQLIPILQGTMHYNLRGFKMWMKLNLENELHAYHMKKSLAQKY